MDATATALIEGRRRLDAGELAWLEALVEFDRGRWWLLDGHLNCVGWLVDRCGMARPTAKEKLRVAHELRRRPLLADALATGDISYCKVRALTRIRGADDETDTALLKAARKHTVAELEELVRHHHLLDEQDRPSRAMARWERRGLHHVSRYLDQSTVEIVQPTEDIERMIAIIDTYLRRTCTIEPGEKDSCGSTAHGEAGEKDSRGSTSARYVRSDADRASGMGPITWSQRRADALTELLEAGLAHLSGGGEIDPDAATISVVVDYATLVDGAPGTATVADGVSMTGDAARRLACDAGLCRIITRGASEVLDVGRRTRQWTTGQRRAIRYRHGGRCAFPGCDRRITQIHHTTPWDDGGPTNLDAGVPLCWGHHHLVHEGKWTVTYNADDGVTTFTSRAGRTIEAASVLQPTRAA